MNPAAKRFTKRYGPIADAIARLDLEQTTREQVASALTDALAGGPDFRPELFWLLAADPLVDCAGDESGVCPHGRSIRVAMHDRHGVDGRSAAWRRRAPTVRCVTCGSRVFLERAGDEPLPGFTRCGHTQHSGIAGVAVCGLEVGHEGPHEQTTSLLRGASELDGTYESRWRWLDDGSRAP